MLNNTRFSTLVQISKNSALSLKSLKQLLTVLVDS